MTRRSRRRPPGESRRGARERAAEERGPRERGAPAHPPAPPVPLRHPAWPVALVVAAGCVLVSVTFTLYEKDFWQHLAVGRAIWELGRVPATHLWTWPTLGAPDLTPSWLFRVLLWPVWEAGGVWGLFAWRWVTTLAVFGLCWATARRLGARGFTPLVVAVLCSLTYRQRSQVRPETLAALWLALEIWLLEGRRQAAGPRTSAKAPAFHVRASQVGGWPARLSTALWLAPLMWLWLNSHVSFPLGFAVLGAFVLDAHLRRAGLAAAHAVSPSREGPGSDPAAGPRASRAWLGPAAGLWLAGAAALALAFLNPYGWRALWQPFEFFLSQRGEPIFASIPELRPLDLRYNLLNLLPLVLFGWPLLILWRAFQRRLDLVEVCLFLGFVPLAFSAQRFLGFTMVVAAPYLARDLDEWVRARRWPAWTSRSWSRAGLASAACVVAGLAEWRRPDLPLGVGIRFTEYPVVACDFMQRHEVQGRGFNQFYLGGYLLYRFWPDRGRLPFMDIHQSGTREDRDAYALAVSNEAAWRELDRRHRFDYALLRRQPYSGDRLLDFLDADQDFALVFLDDAGALYVRRDGPLATVADSFAYRMLPAGASRLGALGHAATTDSASRVAVIAELEREAAGSPVHALASGRLGSLALATGDRAAARAHLEEALRVDARAPRARERLGLIALAEGNPREALRLFETERRVNGRFPRHELRVGQAWQALGDRRRAKRHYERELAQDPRSAEARDALRALEAANVPR